MVIFTQLYQQLGLLSAPFTLLSIVTLMIILERTWVLLKQQQQQRQRTLALKKALQRPHTSPSLRERLALQSSENRCSKGIQLLITHQHTDKATREDIAHLWLKKTRQQLLSGVKILSVIALISPLLGLLGTVLGLIDMFQSLGAHSGAIEASQLAKGLGFAMSTTAVGLILALPALIFSHLFQLWADKLVHQLEDDLNHCNLLLGGAQIDVMEAI